MKSFGFVDLKKPADIYVTVWEVNKRKKKKLQKNLREKMVPEVFSFP